MPVREKGQSSPGSSLHVPSRPQTAAKVRGFSLTAQRFVIETDWLLEGDGFEPLVPLTLNARCLTLNLNRVRP
jgi:hypothetical protein